MIGGRRLLLRGHRAMSETRLFSWPRISAPKQRSHFALVRFSTTTREAVPNPSFELNAEITSQSARQRPVTDTGLNLQALAQAWFG